MNLIFTVGISGSGKSTWVKQFMDGHKSYLCVNRDSLRLSIAKTLNGYYQRPDIKRLEWIVSCVSDTIAACARVDNWNVIMDNTNLTQKIIESTTEFHDIKSWQYKLFDSAPAVAKSRVLLRDFTAMADPGYTDHLPLEKVAYIDKQFEQYKQVKQWLLATYPEKQILD